ncbi:MAG: response regulator transcription factor, partial [Bacteroidetes bacterium]|nr:response regulator transcription factor [Bacteroidota bacterium]
NNITILLVEDHPLFRIGLKQILSNRFPESEIYEAESVSVAKILLSKTVFDVIFLDLNIGEESGLDFLKEIKTSKIASKCIILSMYNDSWLVKESMNSGASAYLSKDSLSEEIFQALNMVIKGKKYVSQSVLEMITIQKDEGEDDVSQLLDYLTPTEKRILYMVADSMTSKEIAGKLGVNHRTIENHRTNICTKLNLSGVNSLMKFALANKTRLNLN